METIEWLSLNLLQFIRSIVAWWWFFVPGIAFSLVPAAVRFAPSLEERLNSVLVRGAKILGPVFLVASTFAAYAEVNDAHRSAKQQLAAIEESANGMLQIDGYRIDVGANNEVHVRAMLKNTSPSHAIEIVATWGSIDVDGKTFVPPRMRELPPLGPGQVRPLTVTGIPITAFKPGQDRTLTTIVEASYGFVGTDRKVRFCEVSKCSLRANQEAGVMTCDTDPTCDVR